MLSIIDISLLLCLAGFVFYGLFFGLIRSVGNIAGLLAGAYGASRLHLIVFDWVSQFNWGHEGLVKVISFIVCFTVISRLVSLAFVIIDKFYSVLTIIPFLKTINRLAGALLGFIQGSFVLGLFLYIIARYTPTDSQPANWLAASKLAPFLLNFGNALVPLLPELLQKLQSII